MRAKLQRRDGELHRFVNLYLNDEDVRLLGWLDTPVEDADTLTILPPWPAGAAVSAPARARAAARRGPAGPGQRHRQHAAGGAVDALAQPGRPHPGQAGEPQSHRLHQGPHGALADRGRRAPRPGAAGRHDHGAHVGQHRHLAGDDLPGQRLPPGGGNAGQRDPRSAGSSGALRRRDRRLAGRAGLERRGRDGAAALRASRASTCPSSTATRPTPRRTTRARPRRSSATARRSTCSWPASGPAAP